MFTKNMTSCIVRFMSWSSASLAGCGVLRSVASGLLTVHLFCFRWMLTNRDYFCESIIQTYLEKVCQPQITRCSWAAFFTNEYQGRLLSSSMIFISWAHFWPIYCRSLCWEFLVPRHVIKGAVGCSKWTHIWLSLSMLAFMMQNKSSAWSKVGQWGFPHVPAVSQLLKKPWSSH